MDQGLEHSTARDSKIYKCNVYVYYGRFPGDWSTHRGKLDTPVGGGPEGSRRV